jgi:hypothetical protein
MAYSRPGVYITERLLPPVLPNGVSANAAGAVVAPFAQGPEAVTLVQSWYEFTKNFGGYNAAFPATFQVAQFFSNGGRELYVKRLLHTDAVAASVNLVTSSSATVATVTSKNAGADGNKLYVVLSAGTVSGTYTLTLYKDSGVVDTFSPSVTGTGDDILLERYENIVFGDPTSSDFAETVINTVSPNIAISNSATGTPVLTNPYPLSSGNDGTATVAADYTAYKGGSASVFEDFSTFTRPLVVFLPAVQSLGSGIAGVYNAAISWAEANNGFVVAETPKGQTVANALTYSASLTSSSNAAVYYPWTYIADPIGRGTGALRLIGPSGAVVGLYLATDSSRGVFKAPAGIGATVSNVVSIEKAFTSADLDAMNSSNAPVNPLRQIPGAGLSVMGARTLKQDGTANKYVNMRRSLIYINKQLNNLTQFAIFENNDEALWARIRTALAVFLNEYRSQGGLRGATASQAYFIKCDGENNTAASIANGEVHIQVGVALQYPAEFIVIDLSQKTLV